MIMQWHGICICSVWNILSKEYPSERSNQVSRTISFVNSLITSLMLIYGSTGMINRRLYNHRCLHSTCIVYVYMVMIFDMGSSPKYEEPGVVELLTFSDATILWLFILGNGINKSSLKRGSPVELLGIQAQRIQKNFCTVGDGSIVK